MQPFTHLAECSRPAGQPVHLMLRFTLGQDRRQAQVNVYELCPSCWGTKTYAREDWNTGTILIRFTRQLSVWLSTYLHRTRINAENDSEAPF